MKKFLRFFREPDRLRTAIVFFIHKTKYFAKHKGRIDLMEVGLTDNVSFLDKVAAEGKGLRPPTRFERWLAGPYIDWAREQYKQAFLGENHNEQGYN